MWFHPFGTRSAQGHSRPLVWVARSRRPRGGLAPATTLRSEVLTSSGFSLNQDRWLSQLQVSCLEATTREFTISQREVQNERASHGAHPLPHSQADSAVERFGRGVLWQLQAGLCLSGVSRNGGRRSASTLGVDRTLQSPGLAQCLGDAVASRVLCGVVGKKQDSTCPKLGGAAR